MVKKKKVKLNRREFFKKTGYLGIIALGIGAFLKNIFLYISPEQKEKTYHKYLVGKKNQILPGKAKEITIQGKPVFVVNQGTEFKVFSGVCTHLGCIIKWEENNDGFYCPCHQGFFDKSGRVVSGPPPTPLTEFPVVEEKNLIYIQVEDKKKGPWA
ncbi:MAG: Rieske (2Fe-2S) protein [Candidatus Marinimicrobia bacterium]|nr:Rieske (2Fe-2S) protein [Candidatus Neomarinimicrobiota bacterium]